MDSVQEYKCPSCRALLTFDPPSGSWKCNYCSSVFSKEDLDKVYKEDGELINRIAELDSYVCSSCGAELIADATTSATFCIYCKSPAIIKSRFSGEFKPEYLIPFKITAEEARILYKKWISKRIFAPGVFKKKKEIDKVTGIYAPFWLFDTDAEAMIEGEGTTVHSWTSGDYEYTQTKYYRVAREGRAKYQKIPVDASVKLDDEFMHLIEPFDYNALKDFSMHYLTGFMAEKYDVDAEKSKAVMQGRANDYLRRRLNETISNYSSFIIRAESCDCHDTRQNYSMLPIYLLINKFKGKDHIFIVNGQTGKVVGDSPVSLIRQILFALAVFAAAWIISVTGGALFV